MSPPAKAPVGGAPEGARPFAKGCPRCSHVSGANCVHLFARRGANTMRRQPALHPSCPQSARGQARRSYGVPGAAKNTGNLARLVCAPPTIEDLPMSDPRESAPTHPLDINPHIRGWNDVLCLWRLCRKGKCFQTRACHAVDARRCFHTHFVLLP